MVFELLKELVFPRKCVFCGGILSRHESGICHGCRTALPEYGLQRYLRGLDGHCAVWYYQDAVRESLLRFKFHNRPDYARVYGPELAMRIQRTLPKADLLTWVPVSKRRLKERGYDQAELLAGETARELGIPAVKLLTKYRDNPAQSGLDTAEARLENVRDAYRIHPGQDLTGKRVILIDDILTTGATAGECARVLREAGAAQVFLAVVASGSKHTEKLQHCAGEFPDKVSTY